MPPLMTVVTAPLMRKLASLDEIRKRLIPNIPRDMAIKVSGELIMHELNHGIPSEIGSVDVSIGRITSRLAQSFGAASNGEPLEGEKRVRKLGPMTWAVTQLTASAPYAGDVADYSQQRFGMTYLDSVRRRTDDYLMKGAKEEWEYAWERIENDRPYKYHPLYGE